MTAIALRTAQKKITDIVYRYAEECNLSRKDELYPITDGVADADAYLASNPKVMWVLKEPYDELDKDQPQGGGWSITNDCFAQIEHKPVALTWHNIVYVLYGIRHGIKYNEIPKIRQDKSIANVLKEISYINVSKMPNKSVTKDSELRRFYETWKEILWKQINLYNPNIIIFGATFDLFKNDFTQKGDLRKVTDNNVWVWKNKLLLASYHPQLRQKREVYVDTIINFINTYYKF